MPLSLPDINEVRTRSAWHPFYYIAATVTNTTSLTRRACDVYEEIQSGEADHTWNPLQIGIANDIRTLYRGVTAGARGGAEVFMGAHVILNDGAAWYYYWAGLINNYTIGSERWSSHYDKSRKANRFSKEMQFEIYFPWNGIHMNWGVLLFGRFQQLIPPGAMMPAGHWTTQARTWFQTEAHSSTRPGLEGYADPVLHIATGWVPYKLTGRNVGPRGLSINTEANPLVHAAPPAPAGVHTLANAQVHWPAMKPVGMPPGDTYIACVVCGAQHGFTPSVLRHWHRCTHCGRVYCPTHGKALGGAYWFDRTRNCANCGNRTELV
jgi:hypothetical protein